MEERGHTPCPAGEGGQPLAHPMYKWYQDNASVTLDVTMPPDALPTHLRMLLGKRRITLARVDDGAPFLSRRTYAPIDPRCTDRYTMPSVAPGAPTVVRIVLYKAVQAGWISLFVGDLPGEGLIPSPAPLSHAMAHVAALARSRDAAAREAAEAFANSRSVGASTRPQQTWRSGCHPIRKKTPGGIKTHYGRNAPERAPDRPASETEGKRAVAASPRAERVRQPWSAVRRQPPRAHWEEEEAAAQAASAASADEAVATGDAAASAAAAAAKAPSRSEAQAARAAIEAVRKGNAPELGNESSDEEGWAGGVDPDEIEYPLPGSDATCDGCGQVVDKYYHCVECGVIDGFDLCERCKRMGVYSDKHERRFPTHQLRLVTKHTAPILPQQPKLTKAPPAPPAPVPGFRQPSTAVSERVLIPLEAKVKHDWTQYSGEVNLSVDLPAGTRARDLIVVVNPFDLSVSLKGYGVILRSSLHKGVRHRETVWTIEEGMLRILLVKSDGQSWKKLFPSDAEMHPMMAIKQARSHAPTARAHSTRPQHTPQHTPTARAHSSRHSSRVL